MGHNELLSDAERALLRNVGSEGTSLDAVEGTLERLLDTLLSTVGDVDWTTDGLTLRREEVSPSAFWALGSVWMLRGPAEQYTEPVWIECAFNAARDAIISGRVDFGILDSALRGGRRSKLENQLLAYPHETKMSVPWLHSFHRDAAGWMRREKAQSQ